MQYGIGTYIRELTEALLAYTDVKLYVVTYHSRESNEFTTETISSRYFKINIPSPRQSSDHNSLSDKRYASVVVSLLSDVISKNEKIVFQMNYVDDLPLIKKLKEKYTHPVISVVHFAQWQQLFNGNRQKLNGLNIDIPTNNIEFTLSREKEMYQFSDHIISVTRYMKDFLTEEYDIIPDKIDIVPNGLDISKFKTVSQKEKLKLKHNLGFGPHERIVLFSGRIDKCKGIFFLIGGFIEACKHNDDLRLVIIGQGDIQDCLKRSDLVYGKITYTGFLTSDQLMAFYQIADVGAVPSIYDHCPYTVLEMMAYKIPLILSRINGLNEMLNEEQCVFVDPHVDEDGEMSFDKKDIAKSILLLVNDEEKAKHITRDYPELIRTKFSGKRMAEEMYFILKSVSVVAVET
jgi:glycosyltransferase